MITLGWLILFLPLFACMAIAGITLKKEKVSAFIACGALALSFLLSLIVFFTMSLQKFPTLESSVAIISLEGLRLEFGILLDRLSLLMLLVVTGIGSTIFFYSAEYMKGDKGFSRYFASLSLFAFSMLGIVVSPNFFQTFVFWELVGVSSYLLIGHWYEKNEAADAGKKAFITTRVGDIGFLIGILLLGSLTASFGKQTLNFHTLSDMLTMNTGQEHLLTGICLLIFCGVLGKSAQFPLHIWLPDAMEGPTPVSALIHAATMVAAGVYLFARAYFLFALSPAALAVIANIGVFTAFFAATMALVQPDIKKILAYSTLSQLGYMVMAVGLGSSSAAMYHLVTHAFFKALLFLGAGSVIHALHTQNIWEMGGVFRRMPVTGWTFLAGFLALAGVFPLSGFWSKDEILTLAFTANRFIFWPALVTAFLTAFYMGRLFFTVFIAEPRWKKEPHESPKMMTVPLLVLAFFAVTGGFLGLGSFFHSHHDRVIDWNFSVVVISLSVSLAGILIAYLIYALNIPLLAPFQKVLGPLEKLLLKKYYMDDVCDALVMHGQQNFAKGCDLFERLVVIQGMVNGTAHLTGWTGDRLRRLQTGTVQFYAFLFSAGMILITFVWILVQ